MVVFLLSIWTISICLVKVTISGYQSICMMSCRHHNHEILISMSAVVAPLVGDMDRSILPGTIQMDCINHAPNMRRESLELIPTQNKRMTPINLPLYLLLPQPLKTKKKNFYLRCNPQETPRPPSLLQKNEKISFWSIKWSIHPVVL